MTKILDAFSALEEVLNDGFSLEDEMSDAIFEAVAWEEVGRDDLIKAKSLAEKRVGRLNKAIQQANRALWPEGPEQ